MHERSGGGWQPVSWASGTIFHLTLTRPPRSNNDRGLH